MYSSFDCKYWIFNLECMLSYKLIDNVVALKVRRSMQFHMLVAESYSSNEHARHVSHSSKVNESDDSRLFSLLVTVLILRNIVAVEQL